jgi:DNA polymerase-3 subunit beta
MNIFVEKTNFANELKQFLGIFEKKSLMEILDNIKITAHENGTLELEATDLEIGLLSNLSVDVRESGTFTVNGKDLYELVSKMPEGNVEISENNDLQIIISNESKSSKYKLLGIQSADYPNLPQYNFDSSIPMDLKKFLKLVNQNYYIISPDVKFNLGGALLHIFPEAIEMASTDGHRLSFSSYQNEFSITDPIEYIISKKTLLELLKIGESGEIYFGFDANNLFFKYKNRILSSRIIDQKFPNYQSVIPAKISFSVYLNRDLLLQTLRRVLIFKTKNNAVFFKFEENKLILERNTPEKGEAHEEIEIDYTGKPISVAFNGNYIIDFLTHIDSPDIQISMGENESSFMFLPLQDELQVNFKYVIMPLNL